MKLICSQANMAAEPQLTTLRVCVGQRPLSLERKVMFSSRFRVLKTRHRDFAEEENVNEYGRRPGEVSASFDILRFSLYVHQYTFATPTSANMAHVQGNVRAWQELF